MKKYAIYGDDDQQRLNEIFANEEEIQRCVDLSNKKKMNERRKQASKKKHIDTTVNDSKPGVVKDIQTVEPTVKKNTSKKDVEKKKKEKKEPKKSTKVIMLVFILIAGLMICYNVVSKIYGEQIKQFFSKDIPNVSSVEEIDYSKEEASAGIISVIDAADKEYSLAEILTVAKNANNSLQSYYNEFRDVLKDENRDTEEFISNTTNSVKRDKAALISYQEHFLKYNGDAYFNTLLDRFENIESLMDVVKYLNEDKVFSFVRKEIEDENDRIVKSKNELVNFLESNNIEYSDSGSSIKFELD